MRHYTELGYLLRISRMFDIFRREHMKGEDLYPALLTVVSFVCRFPGSTQKELSHSVCIDKTTAAHHLSRLEEKGYIRREPSPEDGRKTLIYPTERALALAPALHETYRCYYEQLLQGFSEQERAQAASLFARMYENAQKLAGPDRQEKDA